MNELQSLLKELGCKTPPDEITSERRETILEFLKMETEYRRQHRIKRLLTMSGIKQIKTLEQFDWHFNPKISKEDIMSFVNSPWIEQAFNLVLIGDSGLGKSHIAVSILCGAPHKMDYVELPVMLSKIYVPLLSRINPAIPYFFP